MKVSRQEFHRGQSAQRARRADVLALIDKNFSRFDRDGNGRIAWSEMRQNVADPAIQGEHAAALATLYSLVNDKMHDLGSRRPPSVTPELLDEFRDDRDMAREEGEPEASQLYFERYLGKLEQASDQLFPQGLPDGYAVRQGYGPSCAILATTVGQALHAPEVIQKAVRERADGRVEVAFPGFKEPLVVTPATDSEMALFATAGQNGTWITHIEKAWGQTQTKNPLAAFEQSSWPAKSIRAWSSAPATTVSIPPRWEAYRQASLPPFLRDALQHLEQNRIVMAWSRKEPSGIDELIPFHAHTVVSIDPQVGSVTVRNPWGHKEPLDDQGRPRDGRDDGVFTLSLEEFVRDFGRIAQQTGDAGSVRPGRPR